MASPPPMGSPDAHTMTQNSSSRQSVRKSGYLRKQKHGHKRFFVLRGPGAAPGEPARLEYYESEKKWHSKPAKRSVALDSTCLTVNKRADAKHKYLIALYTRDEYLAVAADSEAEQDSWYQALSDLLNESRLGSCSGCRNVGSSPQPRTPSSCSCASDDPDYGLITPASQVYREVWQVTLKPKGLGQIRNLIGLHRLCLSSRTVAFMRPNAELPAVTLQLMNIRRCGHSDSFFFVELGRSAATGPGELWMQADDAVVAQNIHETILEAMRAMKELAELRPRSKSQSNPISVPTPRRYHHSHPPPSQTGLPGPTRRTRTDSSSSTAATTPPTRLGSAPCTRVRTASEGDRALTLSPGALRTHLSRSNTLSGPRPHYPHQPRLPLPGALQHSRSMSMPVSRSPPSATSPVSLASSSGHGSDNSAIQRPSSCSASVSCSPSDAGFMSLDEYSSSPGEVIRLCPPGGHPPRSNTPESIPETPPTPGHQLNGYMLMDRPPSSNGSLCLRHCHRLLSHEEAAALDPCYRKRTYSLTTPARQRAAPQVSSTSLDEGTLLRAACRGSSGRLYYTASPKLAHHPYPEDYGDVEIGGSQRSSSSNLAADDGYMPMVPGAVLVSSTGSLAAPTSRREDYMPMSPTSVSAPKQILCQRTGSPQLNGYKTGESSPDDSGYMHMMCGSRLSADSSDGKLSNGGDYMNMSPGSQASVTPPDFFFHPQLNGEPPLARQGPPPPPGGVESEPYVMMHSPGCSLLEEGPTGTHGCPPPHHHHHPAVPSPVRQSKTTAESFFHRCRAVRPSRLALDCIRTLPSMNEHPLPPEPKSPGGEYINIDFGDPSGGRSSPRLSAEPHASPDSDYMNLDYSGYRSPRSGPLSLESEAASPQPCPVRLQPSCGRYMLEEGALCREPSLSSQGHQEEKEDYTEMTFSAVPAAPTSPQLICPKAEGTGQLTSPTSGVQRLTLLDPTAFPLPPPDPDRGAKVIRADPQGGRRRHSSETFSSTTTVTPVSPSFAHNPKRHSSASVENVSVPRRAGGEGSPDAAAVPGEHGGGSSPMCRETSAGFQNGLNHIHISADWIEHSGSGTRGGKVRPLLAVGDGPYASMDFFLVHTLREATANGKRGKELILSHDLAAQSTT